MSEHDKFFLYLALTRVEILNSRSCNSGLLPIDTMGKKKKKLVYT